MIYYLWMTRLTRQLESLIVRESNLLEERNRRADISGRRTADDGRERVHLYDDNTSRSEAIPQQLSHEGENTTGVEDADDDERQLNHLNRSNVAPVAKGIA